MAKYRWTGASSTEVKRLSDNATLTINGDGWAVFQAYRNGGGQVDAWKTPTELLDSAREVKKIEILETYKSKKSELAIDAGGNIYPANSQFITELYTEYQLAVMNSESAIIVFDTSNRPHSVGASAVLGALQSMRYLAKGLRITGRALLVDIDDAVTVEEVESIAWE